jgi:hypothetical protein
MRCSLVFDHDPKAWGLLEGRHQELTYRGKTTAKLLTPEGYEVASATAFCSILDSFTKRTGARVALTKLVASLGLAKSQRTALYQAWRTGQCRDIELAR